MEFLEMLREVGALKRGHFLLSSGRHSDQYVEKFDLLRNPPATEQACRQMIDKLGALADVDLVVGPTTGGILLAFEVARQLGLTAAYAERVNESLSERVFKRGTVIVPGTRALVVDDILTTGGSVRSTLDALRPHDVQVKAIAVLVDRVAGTVEFGSPLVSLASLDIDTWDTDECPLCRAGKALVKPGTTPLPGAAG